MRGDTGIPSLVMNKRAMTERIVPQRSSLQMVAHHRRVYPRVTIRCDSAIEAGRVTDGSVHT